TETASITEAAAAGKHKGSTKHKDSLVRRAALDFGSCTNPAIEFGLGFDGRKEDSFQPADKTEFNHGSALNIKVIADFLCSQLASKCKASADTVIACQNGETAALAIGNTGAAADTFNAALGIQAIGGDNAASAVATTTAQAAATSAATPAVASSTAAAAPSGANLQTFAGTLGAAAPVVTASGAQFCVEGNACFNNLQNALVRSCDVQNNQCANAANSAAVKQFSVGDCNQQQAQCISQAKSTS
ncbi:hypothetical protein FRB99_004994, partial [Tulasnella sp. 403]